MKRLPGISIVLILLLPYTDTITQISAGYKIGLNFSTVTLKTNETHSNPDMPAGINFGGIIDIPLRRSISFQPGLIFSAKGSDFKIDSVDFSLAPVYIEIPVNLVLSLGSETFKIFMLAGPYFAIGMGGNKFVSNSPVENIRFGSNADLKLFDFGFNFGTGVNINHFLICAQYGIGLANVSTKEAEMKNRVIGISISSLMPLK
jgi:hypothetical protein